MLFSAFRLPIGVTLTSSTSDESKSAFARTEAGETALIIANQGFTGVSTSEEFESATRPTELVLASSFERRGSDSGTNSTSEESGPALPRTVDSTSTPSWLAESLVVSTTGRCLRNAAAFSLDLAAMASYTLVGAGADAECATFFLGPSVVALAPDGTASVGGTADMACMRPARSMRDASSMASEIGRCMTSM